MSGHDKKARPVRVQGKQPLIAAPPRVALGGGRSKAEPHDDGASIKSVAEGNGSEADEAEASAKDRRISELEARVAEHERELAQLRKRRQEEAETAAFWQQKHSALNQTFLKTDTDLRLLRQEAGAVQQGREDRDRDIKAHISSLLLDREAFREAYNEAMGELSTAMGSLSAKDDTIKALQNQVWGLKNFVSSSSKMDEQVTDEVFGEQMQRLGNSLQNWVITNFRRAKIDTEKASEETKEQLLRLVPTYEALASASKVHLIQSIVSRLFVNSIFAEYFVGLPKEQTAELRNIETYLGGFGSAESMNQWRSTTLGLLRKEAAQKMQKETAAVVEEVVSQVNSILSSISDAQSSEARDQSLRALVTSSIDLSRLLQVQKAIFSVIMPSIEGHQKTMFDAESMEDIGGEDEDTLHEREIRCVTFPGIVKTGDENGESSHLRNVVAKVRVLCAPD